jgi:hypothetical protein
MERLPVELRSKITLWAWPVHPCKFDIGLLYDFSPEARAEREKRCRTRFAHKPWRLQHECVWYGVYSFGRYVNDNFIEFIHEPINELPWMDGHDILSEHRYNRMRIDLRNYAFGGYKMSSFLYEILEKNGMCFKKKGRKTMYPDYKTCYAMVMAL